MNIYAPLMLLCFECEFLKKQPCSFGLYTNEEQKERKKDRKKKKLSSWNYAHFGLVHDVTNITLDTKYSGQGCISAIFRRRFDKVEEQSSETENLLWTPLISMFIGVQRLYSCGRLNSCLCRRFTPLATVISCFPLFDSAVKARRIWLGGHR